MLAAARHRKCPFFRTAAARYASPNAFAQPKPPKKARFRQFSAFY